MVLHHRIPSVPKAIFAAMFMLKNIALHEAWDPSHIRATHPDSYADCVLHDRRRKANPAANCAGGDRRVHAGVQSARDSGRDLDPNQSPKAGSGSRCGAARQVGTGGCGRLGVRQSAQAIPAKELMRLFE